MILKASTFLSSACSGTFLLAPIHQNGREKRKGFLAPKLVRPRLLGFKNESELGLIHLCVYVRRIKDIRVEIQMR